MIKKIICNAVLIGILCMSFVVLLPAANKVFNVRRTGLTNEIPPICRIETDKKKVAITFDISSTANDIDVFLAVLEDNNVKATFFIVGDWARKYPEETKKIKEYGHIIGNHSNRYLDLTQLSRKQIKKEIIDAHNTIKELLDIDMNLFRTPFGKYNNDIIEVAKECGYYTIQYNIDSLDWKEYGIEHEIKQVLNHEYLGPGSIILFHNDVKYTVQSLDPIIKGLKGMGYEMVPLIFPNLL